MKGDGLSCKGCGYAMRLNRGWCCDYLSITGHRRPCPPGDGCTVRTEAAQDPKRAWKEEKPMKAREWDTEKARVLYDAGKLDGEIAAALGITVGAVGFWRRSLGLPSNVKKMAEARRSSEEPPAPAGEQEGSPPPLRGGERRREGSGRPSPAGPRKKSGVSSDEGPIAFSVELEGWSFSLRAPDLEGAARAYACAGRLLENLAADAPTEA